MLAALRAAGAGRWFKALACGPWAAEICPRKLSPALLSEQHETSLHKPSTTATFKKNSSFSAFLSLLCTQTKKHRFWKSPWQYPTQGQLVFEQAAPGVRWWTWVGRAQGQHPPADVGRGTPALPHREPREVAGVSAGPRCRGCAPTLEPGHCRRL